MRIFLAIIFIWFGALKPLDMSSEIDIIFPFWTYSWWPIYH